MRKKIVSLFLLQALAMPGYGFTLYLDNGFFYGPGNAVYNDTGVEGIDRFPDAEVRNIVLTGPLAGFIPFSNNGALEPNVIAEQLQAVGAEVDGLASDGTAFNENADTALRLNFSDPLTGESADFMVVAQLSEETPHGGEPILPDAFGNLTFRPQVLADPGDSSGIVRFDVVFSTGAVTVPVALDTVAGIDRAGPWPSGTTLIGRLGDYDQNGYLDGALVLAGNAPLEMRVGRGNPIAQYRPWTSDIPIAPQEAALLTLQNLLTNYNLPLQDALQKADYQRVLDYLVSAEEGVKAVRGNLLSLSIRTQEGNIPQHHSSNMNQVLPRLRSAQMHLLLAEFQVERLINRANSGVRASALEAESRTLFSKIERVFSELESSASALMAWSFNSGH